VLFLQNRRVPTLRLTSRCLRSESGRTRLKFSLEFDAATSEELVAALFCLALSTARSEETGLWLRSTDGLNNDRCGCVKRVAVFCAGVVLVLMLVWLGRAWRIGQLVHRADSALVIDDDPEVAERESRRLLDWDNDHSQGLLIHGVALFRQQRFDEAIEFLKRVPDTSEFGQEADAALARSLMHLHRYGEAETQLRSCLKQNPSDQSLQSLYFSLLLQTMRSQEAIHAYEAVLNESPADASRLIELLNVQAEPVPARRRQMAILTHCRNPEEEPNALAALGRTSALLGSPTAAEGYFRKAVAADPENRRILLWAADFFLSQGQGVQARAILDQCERVSKGGTQVEAWCRAEYTRLQAEIAARVGDLQEALDLVTESLLKRPSGRGLALKAEVLRRMGRLVEAEDATAALAEFGQADIRLVELHATVRSGTLTGELCTALSDTLRRLGRDRQADAWAAVAASLHRSPPSALSDRGA